MKKYFIITIILNIVLGFLAFYGFINYLIISASKSFSPTIDLIVLLSAVIIDVVINYIIFKILKRKNSIIFVLIPSCVFMLVTGIIFFFIK